MEDKYKKYFDIFNATPGTLQVGWEWSHWLEKLENEIKPKVYVELGIEYGGGLTTIHQVLPDCRLIGIDLKHPSDAVSNLWKDKEYHKNFEFMLGDSHDPKTKANLVETLGGKRVDVMFIDGAHFFDDVYKDWMDYGPLGKIVVFHDITYSQYAKQGGFYVHFLWEYLKTQYEWEELIAPDKERNNPNQWGGIGILYLKGKLGLHPLPTDFQQSELI
jgi:hypothetical protein